MIGILESIHGQLGGLLLACKGDGNHRVEGSLSPDGSTVMTEEVVLGPRSAQGCSESGMWLRGAGGPCKGAVMIDTQLLARGQHLLEELSCRDL